MTKRLSKLLIAGALMPAAFAPAVADAATTRVAVGIGDQSPAMFSDPNYQALGIKKVRYVVRWDAMKNADLRQRAEAFVAAARRSNDRVFFHVSTNDFTPKKATLPSLRTFRRDVGRLVRHFRKKGVREWGVWNEANHKSQPTWDNPRRAAQYFREMKRLCKGCTLVGLDVLDQAGVERYIRRWFSALPRSYRRSSIRVGIHNYSDTNRKRSSGTRSIIRTVKSRNRRATFWLTETGGVVNLSAKSFPCNEARAANRIGYMFTLARKFRRDIDRIYPYSWFGEDCNGFDAGIVSSGGVPRPSYATFKSRARSFTR
ncbi:MAG TPA: hypothetical protein VD931_03575 [Baekduia sp.]|nr:hypothetical protein [Baekduia sp.]